MLKYDIDLIKFSDLKDKIEIPKFQRGLVWSEKKKHEFIRTLKTGLPIGVLLLSQKDDKYLVIDGLQRFSTMIDYAKDYFRYIDKEEISDIDLQTIILSSEGARESFDNYKDAAKASTFKLMREILISEIAVGQNKNLFQLTSDMATRLCSEVTVLPDKDVQNIQGVVYGIVERIFKNVQIDDIPIPIIIFKGEESELADIFQKLNQEGVKLTKYDVFAATWINHTVIVKNDLKFVDHVIKKYEVAREKSNLEIASYDPEEMKSSGELTVFEYAFALGKAIMERCKKLYPKMEDDKVDSIGFLILSELMGLSYQRMGELAEKMDSFNKVDFKHLKDAILESAAFVENALDTYIDAPMKKGAKRASLVCHSELQLASYIIIVFKLKYELTIENGLVQKSKHKDLGKIKMYLPKHYLYDIIRGYWAGSGDSKLEEIIANPETCRYMKDVDKDEFERELMSWLSDSNKKQNSISVAADTKLFLNYVLRESGIYKDKDNYDVEHCVPKDVIKKYYHQKGIEVPMSTVCNLAYIPAGENRGKGELTYYQKQAKDSGTYTLNAEQLKAFGYPEKEKLQFVESTSTLTEQNYRDFIESRKIELVKKFVDSYYK